MTHTKTLHASPARQRLIDLMRSINFGRIENLHVVDGQPQFEPLPQITRTVKIAGSKPKPPTVSPTVSMTAEWAELFKQLSTIGNGVVHRIELARGIPLFIEISGSRS